MSSLFNGEFSDASPFPVSFMNMNPVLSESFAKNTMGLSTADYDAAAQRALDFWANDYELTGCSKIANPTDANGALWGNCDNAVIMHIHVPLDVDGNSVYRIKSLDWDGTEYNPCQLDVSRKLDMLFMATVTNTYNLTSGLTVPAGQVLPNGMYIIDCIKNGCSANSQFIDPIIEHYHQSVEGIGGPSGVFLCDVCSPTLDSCTSVGQVLGVSPLEAASGASGQVFAYTAATTLYPKPSSTA
jgi:hypothetical protein